MNANGRRLVICIVLGALALTGCLGSKSKSKAKTSGSTTSSSSPTTVTPTTETVTTLEAGGDAVTFSVDGTYKGQSVKGSVQAGTLQCTPISTGGKQGLQMTWGGTLPGTGQISGDLMIAGGTSATFGDPKSQGTASVVVKGDYQDRYGASSALGSGTATGDTHSGTIDARLIGNGSDQIHLSGSFKC
jgi:hypothetical protein